MSKARITITAVIEFEQNPERYQEEDRTPERMLAVDLDAARDDTFLFLDNPDAKWTITGEVSL